MERVRNWARFPHTLQTSFTQVGVHCHCPLTESSFGARWFDSPKLAATLLLTIANVKSLREREQLEKHACDACHLDEIGQVGTLLKLNSISWTLGNLASCEMAQSFIAGQGANHPI